MPEPFLPNQREDALNWAQEWRQRAALARQAGIDYAQVRHVAAYDLDRIRKGREPLSEREALQALKAYASGEPIVDEPRRNFIERTMDDARAVVGGVLQYPTVIGNEAADVLRFGQILRENLSEADSPGEQIAAVLDAPGVRMLPGAFVGQGLARGREGLAELAEHPLFTALDVLPVAKGSGAIDAAIDTRPGQWAKGKVDKAQSYMERHALGGEGPRNTARTESRVARLLDKRFEPVRQEMAEKLGMSIDDSADVVRWLERRRKGEDVPVDRLGQLRPDLKPAVDFYRERVEQIQAAITDREGGFFHDGEWYSMEDNRARRLFNAVKRRSKIQERSLEGHEQRIMDFGENVSSLQRLIDELEGSDTPQAVGYQELLGRTETLRTALDEHIKRQAEKHSPTEVTKPGDIGYVTREQYHLPWRKSVPEMHPGEEAWINGQRSPGTEHLPQRVYQSEMVDERLPGKRLPADEAALIFETPEGKHLSQRLMDERRLMVENSDSLNVLLADAERAMRSVGMDPSALSVLRQVIESVDTSLTPSKYMEKVDAALRATTPALGLVGSGIEGIVSVRAVKDALDALDALPPGSHPDNWTARFVSGGGGVRRRPDPYRPLGVREDIARILDHTERTLRNPADVAEQAAARGISTTAVPAVLVRESVAKLRRLAGELNGGDQAAVKALNESIDRLEKIGTRPAGLHEALSAAARDFAVHRHGYAREQARIEKLGPHVRRKVKQEPVPGNIRAMSPDERMLRDLYDEIDSPMEKRKSGLPDEVLRKRAADLEARGVVAVPTTRKLKELERVMEPRYRQKVVGRVKTRTRNNKALADLTAHRRAMFGAEGQMGLIDELATRLSSNDLPGARKVVAKIKREASSMRAQRGMHAGPPYGPGARALQAWADDMLDRMDLVLADRKTLAKASKDLQRDAAKVSRAQGYVDAHQAKLAKAEAQVKKIATQTPSARWAPLLRDRMDARVREYLAGEWPFDPLPDNPRKSQVEANAERQARQVETLSQYSDDELAKLMEEDPYALIPDQDLRRMQRDVTAEWERMKAQGFDPIYVHQVSRGKHAQMKRGTFLPDRITDPSQVRQRSFMGGVYEQNLQVALTHQEWEWFARDATETFMWGGGPKDAPLTGVYQNIDQGGYMHTYQQVWDKLRPEITAVANKRGISMMEAFEIVVPDYFDVAEPFKMMPWRRARAMPGMEFDRTQTLVRQDGSIIEVPIKGYMPKGVSTTIDYMKPHATGSQGIKRLHDKSMDVFRLSVLGFSPRYYTYNVLGGAFLLAARTDPTVFFRHWSEARKMVGGLDDMGKNMPYEISVGAAVADEITTRLSDPHNLIQYEKGRTLANLWRRIGEYGQQAYKLNEWVDDIYRSMAYLEGKRKGGHQAGVALAQKVLQDWDSMLPVERLILRNVFPFYGWLRFIMGYTMSYPFDHPVRMGVHAAAMRQMQEDRNEAMGSRFDEVFWLGSPDGEGEQWTVNLGGMNPWGDVADMFTIGGFLGNLGPAPQGILEIAGIDTRTGRGSLFPDLDYDPVSGRAVARGEHPLRAIISSFVPQTEFVEGIAGTSERMRQIKRENPETWRTILLQSVGIPFSAQHRSKAEEITKAEMDRSRVATSVVREAMRTGDWRHADRFTNVYIEGQLVNVAELKREIAERQAQQARGY